MILFPILLVFLTWLLILWLCNQHKYLNIFEQIVLWFVSALSLFVFELFIGGVMFDKLSLIGPILSFSLCLGLFIYKDYKYPWYIRDVMLAIRTDFEDIKSQFTFLKLRQQSIVIMISLYVILKLFMVFSINISMPTFDEDAVAGWDMKTKVFSVNHSLVLDKADPEFLGSALERNIFAPLTDSYFLLSDSSHITGFTNIISPLMYLMGILLLFGIFLRKATIFRSLIGCYVFTSLPFLFIHWFASYRNFISGILLFLFMFYLIDQLCDFDRDKVQNKYIYIVLSLMIFITMLVRNESSILTVAVFVLTILLYGFIRKMSLKDIKINIHYIIRPLVSIVIAWMANKYVLSLYPIWSDLWVGIEGNMLSSMFHNMQQPWILLVPWEQAMNHPDYNIFFLLFFVVLTLYFVLSLPYRKIILYLVGIGVFLWWTLAMLYANLGLWLVTHLSFIRFWVVFIIPMVFLLVYMMYAIITKYFIVNKPTNGR